MVQQSVTSDMEKISPLKTITQCDKCRKRQKIIKMIDQEVQTVRQKKYSWSKRILGTFTRRKLQRNDELQHQGKVMLDICSFFIISAEAVAQTYSVKKRQKRLQKLTTNFLSVFDHFVGFTF